MQELKKLNFNDILKLDVNVENYDFNEYLKNKGHEIIGFCTRCEEKGCHICPTDNTYRLQNMSHGASTKDLILATGSNEVPVHWHQEGVMLLMEGPSIDWGFYEKHEYNGVVKKPTNEWYWLHDKQKAHYYPEEFKGGKYGSLFNSIVHTFELGNAYMTNLVKCGLNNDGNKYLGIDKYNWDCLQTCVENFLLREVELLQPKVVFAFGSNVCKYLWDLYPEDDYPFLLVGLPHPASRRRGFKDEYFRHLFFSRILEGLYKSGIYTLEQASEKFKEFLTRH